MPQFPVTPAREKILNRIPDYAVELDQAKSKVTITCGGKVIAESSSALIVKETRHADVYYLPRDDVDMSLFTATDLSTYCPFKGHASYWNLTMQSATTPRTEENIVWSYESPYPEVEGLKDYMSFYTDRTEVALS